MSLALLLALACFAPEATITALEGAPHRVAPHGKASIKLLAQGEAAFVGQLTLAPNAKVPTHRDPVEEYIYVLSGRGVVTIDGASTPVGPETLIYMPANAEVSYQNGAQPLIALQIFAGPGPAAKYAKWAAAAP